MNSCTHPSLRQFTFRTGETIRMCPDCTEFDAARKTILNPPPKGFMYDDVGELVPGGPRA
jgi:hypothetical protein